MHFRYGVCEQSLRLTLELNFSIILLEICDAFPDGTLAEEEEAVLYLNFKLRDDTVLNLKALFVSVSKTINNGTKIIRTASDTVGY